MGGLDLVAEVMVAWPKLTQAEATEVAQILDSKHSALEGADPQLAAKLLNDFLDEEPLRRLNQIYDLQIPGALLCASERRSVGKSHKQEHDDLSDPGGPGIRFGPLDYDVDPDPPRASRVDPVLSLQRMDKALDQLKVIISDFNEYPSLFREDSVEFTRSIRQALYAGQQQRRKYSCCTTTDY